MKIIQITDTHLFAADSQMRFGVKSNINFFEVIQNIIDEEIKNTDYILLTGDVSQDESEASYEKAVNRLGKLDVPVYWIPGNHDDVSKMDAIFSTAKNFIKTRRLTLPNWEVLFVDTKLAGSDAGYIEEAELLVLKAEIDLCANRYPDKKIAIVMHHHPIEVNTPIIDAYILKNKEEFWKTVSGTNVSLIICGHVHGDYQIVCNNIVIETAPATSLQWEKGAKELKIDKKIGYKIYNFDKNYSAVSKVW